MSFLDLPRLHFGGFFYAFPDTLNNALSNFLESTPIVDAEGRYLPDAGWGPLGIAQWWLQECRVTAAVGPAGAVLGDGDDPVVGAAAETASPTTPQQTPDGKGLLDIPKMVDLDPDQQFRSALYGVRLFVVLPGGGGFGGLLSVPELQYLDLRVPNPRGSWWAVGTWMGRIEAVEWSGDVSASPWLAAFRDATARGVAVKLTVDLHQNDPAKGFTAGDLFRYGRVLGTMGPVGAGELAQAVPGRRLVTPPRPAPAALGGAAAGGEAGAAAGDPAALPSPVTIDEMFRGGGEEAAATAAVRATAADEPPLPWSSAPALVRDEGGTAVLHVDLGASIQLQSEVQAGGTVSNGQFVVGSGIALGVVEADGSVTPLTHGAVSFDDQYLPVASQVKTTNLVRNAGVVSCALTAAEAARVASRPLAVTVDGTPVLQEPADGLYLQCDPTSVRLEPGGASTFGLMARRFGQPISGQQPATAQVFVVAHAPNGAPVLQPSGDVTVAWTTPTDADGIGRLTATATAAPVPLPADRQPLDSRVYKVMLRDEAGRIVADGVSSFGGSVGNVTVLRFEAYEAPAEPTWDDDVGPVLGAYARLYPGMRDRLDIGDEATVKGFAGALLARMTRPFGDPAYMPVTRDLSPSKMRMIVDWLHSQI